MTSIQPYQAPLPDKIQHAKALADSGMIPRIYQKAPANVLVAIELGEALGIKPIVAINEINVINGTPSPSASLMISLARAAGHKVRVRNDETGAGVCEIIRSDDPEYIHRSVWDEAKAREAGLWGKGHWGKDPATMLRWRAASECVRIACSEVLGGLKYTPEEVREMSGDFGPHVESAPTANRSTPQPADIPPPAQIPTTVADRIADATDVEWLKKTRTYLDRFRETEPDTVEDLQALVDARLESLQAEDDVDAQEGTLDAEIVSDEVA